MGGVCKANNQYIIRQQEIHNYDIYTENKVQNVVQNEQNKQVDNLKISTERYDKNQKSIQDISKSSAVIQSNESEEDEVLDLTQNKSPLIQKKYNKRNSIAELIKNKAFQNNQDQHSIATSFLNADDQYKHEIFQKKQKQKIRTRKESEKNNGKISKYQQYQTTDKSNLDSYEVKDKKYCRSKSRHQTSTSKTQKERKKTFNINNNKYQEDDENFYRIQINFFPTINFLDLLHEPKLDLINKNKVYLSDVINQIFYNQSYYETYSISKPVFQNFLSELYYYYSKRDNPFHNFNHGVMVMHGCYYIGEKTVASQYLSPLQRFSLTLSGLCHDVNHTAHTNAFEQNDLSKLARRYSDKSVLEMYHIATTFKILENTEFNILKDVDNEVYKQIRKCIINNVLSTDIAIHFDIMKDFEKKFLIAEQEEQEDGKKIKYQKNEDLPKIDSEIEDPLLFEKQRNLLSGMITHTADFHGNAQEFEISSKWSILVSKEFTAQYELEQQKGLPLTGYMAGLFDKPETLAKAEDGFIGWIVRPLYSMINIFLDQQLQWSLDQIENNSRI